jgi:hypothetical protein
VTDILSEQQPRTTEEDLQQAKERIAGPVPIITATPNVSLTLPRGLFHNGTWQQEATVRELTGADEEALAKAPDQIAFYSMVIALGTESIGELNLSSLPLSERRGLLGGLLLGERDQLFVKVVQASFGDNKELLFNCTLCGEQQTIDLILSEDFKPKEVDAELAATTVHTYTTNKGDVLEYRAVTGADQEGAVNRKGASMAEQNSVILSQCITKLNGQMILDPMAYVRNLGIRDRQTLLQKLMELQPSIDLTLNTKCAACGGDQTVALGWGDIFRP